MALFLGTLSAAVTLDDSSYQQKLAELEKSSLDAFENIRQIAQRNLIFSKFGYRDLDFKSPFLDNQLLKNNSFDLVSFLSRLDFARYLSDNFDNSSHFSEVVKQELDFEKFQRCFRDFVDVQSVSINQSIEKNLSSATKDLREVSRFSRLTFEELKGKPTLTWQ